MPDDEKSSSPATRTKFNKLNWDTFEFDLKFDALNLKDMNFLLLKIILRWTQTVEYSTSKLTSIPIYMNFSKIKLDPSTRAFAAMTLSAVSTHKLLLPSRA